MGLINGVKSCLETMVATLKSIPELWEAEVFTTQYITLYVTQYYLNYLL